MPPLSPVEKEKLKYSHCGKRRHTRKHCWDLRAQLRTKPRNASVHTISSKGEETSSTQPNEHDPRNQTIKDLQHQLTTPKASLNSKSLVEQPGTYETANHVSNSTSFTPWIFKSWATDHMTGETVGFLYFSPASSSDKVADV
ncbi:hypothetical protein AMTR_s00023p00224740 [Amborella trichopoda]|uniref:Uncharacterized protein n=1 Tax=Amborella trichopoda TaxID=13333 RepID=W1NKG1_AMBTC|nr:hypothetical protein AMTR_s00023p00224740 [Amborella trichopoda]